MCDCLTDLDSVTDLSIRERIGEVNVFQFEYFFGSYVAENTRDTSEKGIWRGMHGAVRLLYILCIFFIYNIYIADIRHSDTLTSPNGKFGANPMKRKDLGHSKR